MDYQIVYSQKQVEYLIEVAKVLIPVSTAFLGFLIACLPIIQEKGIKFDAFEKILLACPFFLTILSILLWCGTLAFMIDCSHSFERYNNTPLFIPISWLNWEFKMGQYASQLGLFFQTLSALFLSYLSLKKIIYV